MEISKIILRISLPIFIASAFLSCNSNSKSEQNAHQEEFSNPAKNISQSHTILIKGMRFEPSEIHLKKGDTVIWINRDIVVHDATEFSDKKWSSGPMKNGDTWKMEVNKSYDYFCSIHITMKGKIIVEPIEYVENISPKSKNP